MDKLVSVQLDKDLELVNQELRDRDRRELVQDQVALVETNRGCLFRAHRVVFHHRVDQVPVAVAVAEMPLVLSVKVDLKVHQKQESQNVRSVKSSNRELHLA